MTCLKSQQGTETEVGGEPRSLTPMLSPREPILADQRTFRCERSLVTRRKQSKSFRKLSNPRTEESLHPFIPSPQVPPCNEDSDISQSRKACLSHFPSSGCTPARPRSLPGWQLFGAGITPCSVCSQCPAQRSQKALPPDKGAGTRPALHPPCPQLLGLQPVFPLKDLNKSFLDHAAWMEISRGGGGGC